ncbi:MAG: cytochrome-c peroxidase [Candidatus Nitrospinota bacterium M3_3B_026]
MKNSVKIAAPVLAVLLAFSAAWAGEGSGLLSEASGLFEPLPEKPVFKKQNPPNEAKLKLGKMLYFERRLSKSQVFSCASCHDLATGGVDNAPLSTGHKWKTGGRNAPTVYNASLHIAQFWDGRAKDVEAQAQGPVLAGVEMAASKDLVMKRLKSIPEYVRLFREAFPGKDDPLTYEHMADAIGAFERTLLTPSRFDRFLRGDEGALTRKEKKGLETFMGKGCVACHNGVAVGGGMYQKFGLVNTPEGLEDKGRYEVTKDEADTHVFKVPSLRNIELTYPYFHDGSVWDLRKAVRIMGWTQLGEKLTDDEIGAITAFLKSLTGQAPEIALPILPPSTPETPKPDRM